LYASLFQSPISWLLVRFKWTKTIQFGDRVLYIPLVAIPSSKLCPVSAYKRMCEFNPASTESPALLIESRGKVIPLGYNQFHNKLKQLISLIGLNLEYVIKVAVFVSEITRNYVLTFLTNNNFLNFISNF
jgi:hypothetical protein